MAKLPLTEEKLKWARNRSTTLRGTALRYNVSQQRKYHRAISELVRQMTAETKSQLIKLFNGQLADSFFEKQAASAAMDASITVKAKKLTNALMAKFQSLFDLKAPDLAADMVEGAKKTSESALAVSLKQLSGGLALKTGVVPAGMEEIAKSSIAENVSLIKSIPSQYFEDITGSVFRSITTGRGLMDLLPQIKKYDMITARRAKMIAYDQTRKAYAFINKERMQAIGVKQFEWLHSGGSQKPRKSHIAMSGQIFSFDDLPQINKDNPSEAPVYGIPGQTYNCSCVMISVIKFNED